MPLPLSRFFHLLTHRGCLGSVFLQLMYFLSFGTEKLQVFRGKSSVYNEDMNKGEI